MTLKIQRLFHPETKALILSDHGHNPWNELVKAHAQQQGITPSTAEEIITSLDLVVVALPQANPEKLLAALTNHPPAYLMLVGREGPGDQANSFWSQPLSGLGTDVLGPSRIGMLLPETSTNLGGLSFTPAHGYLGLVTQSDAMTATVAAWANRHEMGLRHIITLAPKDHGVMEQALDHMAQDHLTRAILLHVHEVQHVREFLSSARAAAFTKPVVVLKTGRHLEPDIPSPLISSLTCSREQLIDKLFRRAGLVIAKNSQEMFQAATILTSAGLIRRVEPDHRRLAFIGNGSSLLTLGADQAKKENLPLGKDEHGQPIIWDLGADAGYEDYKSAIEQITSKHMADAILVAHSPFSAGMESKELAQNLAEYAVAQTGPGPVLLFAWMGDAELVDDIFSHHHLAHYPSPEEAIHSFRQRLDQVLDLRHLREIPAQRRLVRPQQRKNVADKLRHALARDDMVTVSSLRVRGILSQYGIALSRRSVSPNSVALALSLRIDPDMGPFFLFGRSVQHLGPNNYTHVLLPPFNEKLTEMNFESSPLGKWLTKSLPKPLLNELHDLLLRFQDLVLDHPSIKGLEVDPLIIDQNQLFVREATLLASNKPRPKLAIAPYPSEYEEMVTLKNGRKVFMRPIRSEDGRPLQRAFEAMSPEDRRFRLFGPSKGISDQQAAIFTQIDYDREICLVVEDPDQQGELWGGARVVFGPDGHDGEFSVSFRSELKGHGLGINTLGRVLDHAHARGAKEIWGSVLQDNKPMLALARKLGFKTKRDPDEPNVVKAFIKLPRKPNHPNKLQSD